MSDQRIPQDERAVPCTEDSGLHDLRALSTALSERGGRASSPELFAAPSWAPPRPAPAARQPRPASRLSAAIVVATLAVSAVALAAVPGLRSGTAPEMVPATASAPARATTPSRSPGATREEPAPAQPAPSVTPPEPAPGDGPVGVPSSAGTARARRRDASRPRTTQLPPELRPERAPASTTVPGATPEPIDPALDGLLEAALHGARPVEAREVLPAIPSSREVTSTLRALEREVATCREGDGGIAATRLVIDGATGRVSRVQVSTDDPQARACVERIVGDAQFPRFAQERFAVTFPYRL